MKVDLVPLSAGLIPACQAFNARLRVHGESAFLLAERVPAEREVRPGGIASTNYVAVDETGTVRGGVLLMEQRGWVQQRVVPLINIQSPLSEGAVDRKFSGVGLQILKFIAGRSPYIYAVGMGSERNPFARLLIAAGWTVTRVPFLFAVIRAGRFLTKVETLRHGPRKYLARFLAASGLGATATAAWRLMRTRPPLRGYSLMPTSAWPRELDEVWNRCRAGIGFGLLRDASAVTDLYPKSETRLNRYLLRSGGEIVGWSVTLVTPMQENGYFGDLVVGTILDALAPREHLAALLTLTDEAMRSLAPDLIITNQMHEQWQQRFRRLGYFKGPSNYLLAMSKPLASALLAPPEAFGSAYVNRGDGDGRGHL